MAKRRSNRRVHSSPGVSYKEVEVQYSTKSNGITTLGLAGETVKGPAFQPISIEDWNEFESYFGGTNTQKFRGSQYPKYELPYIAKEYLKKSKKLEVVRTLGFSGVNAGPAWVITATKYNTVKGYNYVLNDEVSPASVVINVDNYGKTVFFTVPGPYRIEDTEEISNLENTITVVNGYKNGDNDIIFFDDYAEEFYDCLSNNAKEDYRTIDDLKVKVGTVDGGIIYNFESFNDDASSKYADGKAEVISSNGTMVRVLVTENTVPEWVDRYFRIYTDDIVTINNVDYYPLYEDNDSLTPVNVLIKLGAHDYNPSKLPAAMYINYPEKNIIDGGKMAIVYNNMFVCEIAAENIGDETNPNYVWPSGMNFTETGKDYAIVTFQEFKRMIQENYDIEVMRDDFNISRFKIYHYNFVASQNIEVSDGMGYEYNLSKPKDITIEDSSSEFANIVIGILRSRGQHKKSVPNGVDECGNTTYTRDGIDYFAKNVRLVPSTTLTLGDSCNPGYNTETGDFNISPANYGKFTIAVDSVQGCSMCGENEYIKNSYSVSLNPMDKNYITKVIGTDPEVGDADVYVEELYDVALEQLIYAGEINAINAELAHFPYVSIVPEHEPVNDLLTEEPINLSKKDLGKRYLYTYAESLQGNNGNGIRVRTSNDGGITWTEGIGMVGHIYTVLSTTNQETGKKEYFYGEYRAADGGILKKEGGNKKFTEYLRFYQFYRDVVKNDYVMNNCVKVAADDMYYIYTDFEGYDTANEGDVRPITLDFNNYKDEYRYSSTPWIVSEMKGSGSNVHLHKLFRFHTISDGDNSVDEIKVSIENIDPESETFDVVVRSFYDSDTNPSLLERFGKCCLTPGESNYIGLKIGTFNGDYDSKSAYITVEINEDDMTSMSIPCGFLGYPVRNYKGFGFYDFAEESQSLSSGMKQPYIKFNTTFDEDMSTKKQYFGFSDLVGIDTDILTYKGVEAYNDDPEGLTPCFHLDARILNGEPEYDEEKKAWYVEEGENRQYVDVDGVSGYNWVTVSKAEVTDMGIEPRIGTEEVMEGTIYEDKRNRKFTVCFYGGWDGWDYYRTSRSNSDDFRANKYKGSINKSSGVGIMFSTMKDPSYYGFDSDTKVITSDYYAYMAAYKQLDNPGKVLINVFATPGIDYVNQTALVTEVNDMLEEERGDALYVVTTPDKPFGAGDSEVEMYSPEEAVANLEDSGLDTNYACTYYPWIQYFDKANNMYIYLPPTTDVVRNIAHTDNTEKSWFAAAGWNRGDISGIKPRKKLKVKEEGILYEGRINYVKPFAKEGDKIWGDKNLQIHDGVMNRISKRRLVLLLKNKLSKAFVGLIFDPNDQTMVDTFESALKAVLDPIKKDRGIFDYRYDIDESAEARDRLELPAVIHIKPTQLLEFIDITLAVTPTGVKWD